MVAIVHGGILIPWCNSDYSRGLKIKDPESGVDCVVLKLGVCGYSLSQSGFLFVFLPQWILGMSSTFPPRAGCGTEP